MRDPLIPHHDLLADAPPSCRLSAEELAQAYRAGTLSPVTAAREAIERARWAQERFNAFTHIDPDGALADWKYTKPRLRC